MREILFRGKWFGNNEWVEGALYSYYDFKRTIVQILKDRTNGIPDAYEVHPETVGQYTGLKDKNGKRIFEGDVVQFQRVNALGWLTQRVGEVLFPFDDETPCFYVYATTGDAWSFYSLENIVVIGNTHDNPELLKDGEG